MILLKAFNKHLNPCVLSSEEIELIKDINNHFLTDSKKIPRGKGFTIAGNLGTGKTSIFKIVQWSRISTLYLVSTKSIIENYEFYIRKMEGRNVVIDDLGEETLGNDYGKATDFIGNLISRRYEEWKYNGVLTYFTTNNTPAQIEEKYGERIYSRYKEMQTWIRYPSNENKRGLSVLIPPQIHEEKKDLKKIEKENMAELDRLINESIKQKKNLLKTNTKGSFVTYHKVASVAYKYKAKEFCSLTNEEKLNIFKESCGFIKLESIEDANSYDFKVFLRYLKKEKVIDIKSNKYYRLAVTRSEAKAFEVWLESQF